MKGKIPGRNKSKVKEMMQASATFSSWCFEIPTLNRQIRKSPGKDRTEGNERFVPEEKGLHWRTNRHSASMSLKRVWGKLKTTQACSDYRGIADSQLS